ncbi:hypothetical protein ABZ926_31075 [Streptomyces litmocidini]|uniref:hypothetical protein n=1 Tax=Streptomyces litmocidini TaxID=67318 RepID=UPI0033D5FC83
MRLRGGLAAQRRLPGPGPLHQPRRQRRRRLRHPAPDKPCRPEAGTKQKSVLRTDLFIHSETTCYGTQGKGTPVRDDADRRENANDYKSLGCIKLTPTDIKDLFKRLDQARWPKNLILYVIN